MALRPSVLGSPADSPHYGRGQLGIDIICPAVAPAARFDLIENRKVAPPLPSSNQRYHALLDSETGCQLGLRHAISIETPDGKNLAIRESCCGALHASAICAAPLSLPVAGVIEMRSKEQVCGVYACWNVARVENTETVRNSPVASNPHGPMCPPDLSAREQSISVGIPRTIPENAILPGSRGRHAQHDNTTMTL
jgi:hypothetical protein